MLGAEGILHSHVRGDQVRLEVQEAHAVPATQVRAGVREARLRVRPTAQAEHHSSRLLPVQPGKHQRVDDPGSRECAGRPAG